MYLLFEEADPFTFLKAIFIGVCLAILVLIPYFAMLSTDLRNYENGRKDEISFIAYLKKDSYRVLDILAIIYFLSLWLMYGFFYVFYVASIWIVEKLEQLLDVTVFTKRGKRG
ncbi:hypothetical protein G3M74_16755 [Paenibacillus polymyxa]|nr:hypothetical protein [Paenibacillus polymyxa]